MEKPPTLNPVTYPARMGVSPEHDQDKFNLVTLLAEIVPAANQVPVHFNYYGGAVYDQSGKSFDDTLDNGITEAEKLPPNLRFELPRRLHEKEEPLVMCKMAEGWLPNTTVIVSDFPPELMNQQGIIGTYDADRKDTMLRIIHYSKEGGLEMYSQSLDLSDRESLEAIYNSLGFQPHQGELLGQRIHLNIQAGLARQLTDRLRQVYDQKLQSKFGRPFFAGREVIPGQFTENALDFVMRQGDLLGQFDYAVKTGFFTEQQKYDLAAAMVARYNSQAAGRGFGDAFKVSQTPIQEILHAGAIARARGQQFAGCGVLLDGGEQARQNESLENNLERLGYGNKTDEETVYDFNTLAFCIVCQAPPKSGEGPKWCGPCKTCTDCDPNYRKFVAGGKIRVRL